MNDLEHDRSAQIFESQTQNLVVVLFLDHEDVIADFTCNDMLTAEQAADEWIEHGKTTETSKRLQSV